MDAEVGLQTVNEPLSAWPIAIVDAERVSGAVTIRPSNTSVPAPQPDAPVDPLELEADDPCVPLLPLDAELLWPLVEEVPDDVPEVVEPAPDELVDPEPVAA